MKILIGYDGSECAKAALTDLQRAGLPKKGHATIISAADVFMPSDTDPTLETFPNYVPPGVKLARERASNAFQEMKQLAADAGQIVRKMFPRWEVSTEAQAESPHWAIILKSEEWKPDLIVVGSHGRSGLGRVIFGSVSQKVLYEANSSVRIARGKDRSSESPIRLILGTDGSADADAMVDVVASRKWQAGTEVKLITAVETFRQYSTEPDVQMNRIRDLQNAAMEKLAKAGLSVTPIVTEEDPKHFLVKLGKQWDADCIFVGAKGHRFLDRLFLGSISSAVAARALCTVEVVRRMVK